MEDETCLGYSFEHRGITARTGYNTGVAPQKATPHSSIVNYGAFERSDRLEGKLKNAGTGNIFRSDPALIRGIRVILLGKMKPVPVFQRHL